MTKKSPPALRDVGSALLAGALLFLGALPVPGAPRSKPEVQKSLQYDVTVALKLVQVYVTGKDGQPVSDLNENEFEVFDNGQKVSVSHFEKHFPESPGATARAATPGLERKFLLLFDFGFTDIRGVLRAKNAGLELLDTMIRPGDEVGLLTYTAFRGLVLHEYLTTDHAKIRRLVDGFGLRQAMGRAENLTNYLYTVDLEGLLDTQPGQPLSMEQQLFQEQAKLQLGQRVEDAARQSYADRVRRFVATLNSLAITLRGIPGYKNIILFSGGVARQLLYGKGGGAFAGEWSTPEQLAQQLGSYDDAQADSGLRQDFTKMLREFKASNCPVYAMDVSRTQKDSDPSIRMESRASVRELEGADSLRQFASETGGEFYANTVEPKTAVEKIQDATGAYYVLGFSVPAKWDGKFHKIKVKVTRKGCKVQSQGGYFNPKPFSDYSSFEKLLHIIDLALADTPELQIPETIPVAATTVTLKGWPQLLVFGRASRAAQAGVLGKKAEAYLLLTDEPGDIVAIKHFRLDLPEAGKDILFPSFLLPMKAGSYTCRLVLRNLETGTGARGSVPFVVPANPGAVITLDPPLLLTPESDAFDQASSSGESLSALYGYDANTYAPLLGDIAAGAAKLTAALRCTAGSEASDLEVSAVLGEESAASQTAVPVNVIGTSSDGPTVLMLTEVGLGDIGSGRYTLTFTVGKKSGPATASAAVHFAMK